MTARHLVERYPDVALDVLRGAGGRRRPTPAGRLSPRITISAAAGWNRNPVGPPFATRVTSRASSITRPKTPPANKSWSIFTAVMPRRRPMSVSRRPPRARLAWRWNWTLCSHRRSAGASRSVERGRSSAGSSQQVGGFRVPHQTVKILLLLSDAQRRSGQDSKAAATWKEAAELAASLLESPHALANPAMWERLAYLRPVNTPWPSVIALELNRRPKTLASLTVPPIIVQASVGATPSGRIDVNEAQVWAMIGQWRFNRSEPQGALLAFKQGQTFAQDQVSRDRLELWLPGRWHR